MELSVYQIIWIASGSVLVIGWLVVSFAPPSRYRTVIEWLSVTAMYLAILTIFVSLALRMYASGHVFGAWAIGVICALFAGALLVSAWKTVSALGGEEKNQSSTTN